MSPAGVATGVAGGLLIAFGVLAAAVALVRAAERLRTWALARWDLHDDDEDEADRVELAALGAREDADVVAEAERITRDAPPPGPPPAGGIWPTGPR